MTIHRIFKKVILIRKCCHSPPQILWNTPPAAVADAVLRFRSARALPNERRFAKVGPEGAQNLDNNAFRVFRVFALGR